MCPSPGPSGPGPSRFQRMKPTPPVPSSRSTPVVFTMTRSPVLRGPSIDVNPAASISSSSVATVARTRSCRSLRMDAIFPSLNAATVSPPCPPSEGGDELGHALVTRPERILAKHRPLRLIVELQVYPVDREVAALAFCRADELASELCPCMLWRLLGRPFDVFLLAHAFGVPAEFEDV